MFEMLNVHIISEADGS